MRGGILVASREVLDEKCQEVDNDDVTPRGKRAERHKPDRETPAQVQQPEISA